MIRKRKFPVVGDGGGVWSFVHIADAAEAAVENGGRGVYNIVDDEPELRPLLRLLHAHSVPRFTP